MSSNTAVKDEDEEFSGPYRATKIVSIFYEEFDSSDLKKNKTVLVFSFFYIPVSYIIKVQCID